jgi:GH25 family lysozyme M1 (1,4-beta-N-acetylmuramidase)
MIRVIFFSLCISIAASFRNTSQPALGLNAGNELEDLAWSSKMGFPIVSLASASDHGVDMSTAVSKDAANCMVDSYSFIIPRGYHSTGEIDTNVCNTITHANGAGFKVKDAYMFPCPTCSKSAATQVTELTDYLNANCPDHWSGRLWLDIEGSQYWTGSTSDNKEFYEHLVNSCNNKSPKCGIYSSSSQWSAIFGSSSYSYGSDLPLWYAHYDGSASFDDFTSFGGWKSPHAKQFKGTTTVCGVGVDKNYAPNF